MTGGPQTDTDLRVAASDDPEPSAAIIEEVAAWGKAKGFPSWLPGSFTGLESVGISRLRSDIAVGGLYLIWRGERSIGTLSLLENDPMFWPDAGDEAMYLHRFAVTRGAAGAGRHAVHWCLREARRRGRSYVRLDCLRDNPGIRRYYESFGFVAVDEKLINGTQYSLYEAPVASAT
jgi:GNAT superfamily N-acetyltransferase